MTGVGKTGSAVIVEARDIAVVWSRPDNVCVCVLELTILNLLAKAHLGAKSFDRLREIIALDFKPGAVDGLTIAALFEARGDGSPCHKTELRRAFVGCDSSSESGTSITDGNFEVGGTFVFRAVVRFSCCASCLFESVCVFTWISEALITLD